MEKEKLISKLNIKDYNNQLEKILSKKPFFEDIKNLLLSMLYKIENAYEDYILVNGETKTKKETLEQILKIIANDCKKIEIVNTKESKTIEKEKKIITYLDTKKMLYEIYQIDSNKFKVLDEYSIIKNALEYTLNQGYSIASDEVIRDFDGWSWNIIANEIEDLMANFIYQSLKIIVGQDFLENWKKDGKEDYIVKLNDKLENEYKAEMMEKIITTIIQMAILNIVKNNEQEKNRLIEIQNKLQKEANEMENKKEYITALGVIKKQTMTKIKKIDNILNNDRALKREFIDRNQLLDMEHRIFSLSDLAEILEKEREEQMQKLDECSKKMEPLNYIKNKEETFRNLAIIKELNLKETDEEIYNKKTKELIEIVNKAIKIKVEKTENKEELIRLIYKIRYYSKIYIENDKKISEIADMNPIQKYIITEACKRKNVTIFSKNIKENYDIIKNILELDIIELEKIYFKFVSKNEKIELEIYDEENKYKTIEFDKIEELNVKMNKKIKVFI